MHISSKSFINIKNSKGPSTDPCGTPLYTSPRLDHFPFIHTLCFLLLNQLPMVRSNLPLMPCFFRFSNNIRRRTLSKALARSKNTTSTQYPSSTLRKILSRNSKRLVKHKLLFLNACCESLMSLFFSKKWTTSSLTITSNTLHSWLVRLMSHAVLRWPSLWILLLSNPSGLLLHNAFSVITHNNGYHAVQVIQSHQFWYQSKAYMRLLVSG